MDWLGFGLAVLILAVYCIYQLDAVPIHNSSETVQQDEGGGVNYTQRNTGAVESSSVIRMMVANYDILLGYLPSVIIGTVVPIYRDGTGPAPSCPYIRNIEFSLSIYILIRF